MRLLAVLLLLSTSLAETDVNVPFNIRLHESFLSPRLAAELANRTEPPGDPATEFEKFYIQRESEVDEYLCAIPPLDTQKFASEQVPEPQNEAEVLARAVDIIHSSFSEKDCVWSYELKGNYWTYAFCNGDKIIQYHEGVPPQERGHRHVAMEPSTVFVLGRFSRASMNDVKFANQAGSSQYAAYAKEQKRVSKLLDEKTSPFSHHTSQKVVLQMVTDGSVCDVTLQPRTIEVVYKCDPSGGTSLPQIMDVLEIKTCHYKMFVHIPLLCFYEPFIPNKNIRDALVDIVCQRVGDEETGLATFEDHVDRVVLRDSAYFPVRADNRINIAGHHIMPLNRGFYLARSKTGYKSPSTYFNDRNVVLFNGVHEDLMDLNKQFGEAMFQALDSGKIGAPVMNKNGQQVLDWSHSFILWFEVYNYQGEFLGLSRIERDGSKKNMFTAQFSNPVTLVDLDGDVPFFVRFAKPDFEAPLNMWNFEMFSNGDHSKFRKHRRQKVSPDDSMVEVTRSVVVYNKGMGRKGMRVEVRDADTGEVLPGRYQGNQYVFEVNAGSTTMFFNARKLQPEDSFVGYTILYHAPREEVPSGKANEQESVLDDLKITEEEVPNEEKQEVHPEQLVQEIQQADDLDGGYKESDAGDTDPVDSDGYRVDSDGYRDDSDGDQGDGYRGDSESDGSQAAGEENNYEHDEL